MKKTHLKTFTLITALSCAPISAALADEYQATAHKASESPNSSSFRQSDLHLYISGYVKFLAGFYDSKYQNENHREFLTASEIHFDAVREAANGVEYSAFIQLRTSTDDRLNADKVHMSVKTRCGLVDMGDNDGASDLLAYYAPNLGFGQAVDGFGQSVDADFTSFVDGASAAQIGPKALDTEAATKITYLSPRLYGLRVGISYVPEFDKGENIVRTKRDDLSATSPGPSQNPQALNRNLIDYVQPNQDGNRDPNNDNFTRGNSEAFFTRSFRDIIEVGANYNKEFNDVMYRISAGYVHGENKKPTTAADRRKDINAWSVGAEIDFNRNFRIGGSYVDNQHSGQLKRLHSQDRKAFNFGAVYESGPWGVSGNFITEDLGGSNTHGSGKYNAFGLGATYQLAPGIMVGSDLVFYERKFGRDPANPSRSIAPSGLPANKHKDKGYVWLVGTELDF
ncbi:MAG: porin [Alphaproteobacteria bacterium]|nr:porin [Alphaproteobacteria bacterium]